MKSVFGYVVKDAPASNAVILDSPSKVFRFVKFIGKKDREHLVALYLNARSQAIQRDIVSIGTLCSSFVHPREIFKGAILSNAAAVILAHNHPSNDVSPSSEDKDATRRILSAGEILGIPLLDHLIIGRTSFYSFKGHGLLGG